MNHIIQCLILFISSVSSLPLIANQDISTFDHIQSSRVLSVGYRELPPFSFSDGNGKVKGYTISLCNIIAEKLRLHLNINKLTINYVPVNFANRFSALNNHEIDMDCSVNTIAPERLSNFSFSMSYYMAKMRIVSLRKKNIHTLDSLYGQTVSLPGGSKDLLEFNKVNREKNLNISVVTTATVDSAFNKMANNEVAALLLDDALAYQLINNSKHPEKFSVSSERVGSDMPYAIMMRKNDPRFVDFVDNSLKDILSSKITMKLILPRSIEHATK